MVRNKYDYEQVELSDMLAHNPKILRNEWNGGRAIRKKRGQSLKRDNYHIGLTSQCNGSFDKL